MTEDTLTSGQRLARGVSRALLALDYACIEEFVPDKGLRVDVIGIGPKAQIWIVECKSSRADFQSDSKWQGYLPFCDRFFWAVDSDFPIELLPEDTGLMIADGYGAEISRMAPETPLSSPRRKNLTAKFARTAAKRLQLLRDPMAFSDFG